MNQANRTESQRLGARDRVAVAVWAVFAAHAAIGRAQPAHRSSDAPRVDREEDFVATRELTQLAIASLDRAAPASGSAVSAGRDFGRRRSKRTVSKRRMD
jgi:hypothetical protein